MIESEIFSFLLRSFEIVLGLLRQLQHGSLHGFAWHTVCTVRQFQVRHTAGHFVRVLQETCTAYIRAPK